VIEQAAARLRHFAIVDGYAGMEYKHVVLGMAPIFDELARHIRELHSEVRRQVVESARSIVEGPTSR
jgi:hypothetical protein